MKATLLAVCLIPGILISGCAPHVRTKTQIFYPMDSGSVNAHTKISEAAVSASTSLNELAEIEKATHPKAKLKPPPDPDSIGLGTLASIDWTGPIEPLIMQLARIGHYKYRVLGKRPAIPVIVAIDAVNIPVADMIRDANFQADQKADVIVYPSSRTIELRYRAFKRKNVINKV